MTESSLAPATPGPWSAEDDGTYMITVRDADWGVIALMRSDHCIEDGRLIAAAPDLLAALKAIFRVADGASLPGPVHLSIAEVYAARAAIEKAEGGSHA